MEEAADSPTNNGPHKRYRKDETPQPHKRYRLDDISPSESNLTEYCDDMNTSSLKISSKRIMYERRFIMNIRNAIINNLPLASIPFIPGVTKNVADHANNKVATDRAKPLFYAVARGPGKLGVFPSSEIWNFCDLSGFKKDGGKCVRCKEHARGKACYIVRGFSKREDATLYVYHHREDLSDENCDELSSSKQDEVDIMSLISSDWCLELLDFERQKEVRPVLCQNWTNILDKFGLQENKSENELLIENSYNPNITDIDKSIDQNSSDLNVAFIQTPSKLNEITRKIAIQYENDGKEQLQSKLRSLEEEQSKIKNNLLIEIIKSGVSFGDARTEMQKKIEDTFKTVSEDMNYCPPLTNDISNSISDSTSAIYTPKKIKRESSNKRDSSTKKYKNSKTIEDSKRKSKTPRKLKMNEALDPYRRKSSNRRDTTKRSKNSEKMLSSIRRKSLENNHESINKIMAGKWL